MSKYATSNSPNSLPISSFSTREVTVDVQAETLRSSVQGHDLLILRVVGLVGPGGSGGRQVSRSIRIPADMLQEDISDSY